MRLHSYILVSPFMALMQSGGKLVGKGVIAVYIQNIHEDELLVEMEIHVDELHDGKANIISDSAYIRIRTLVRSDIVSLASLELITLCR